MSAVIVRYQVNPGRGEENAELVRAVYAELAEREPPGFRYATFVLDDGVSFVHVAFTAQGKAPLPELAAFRRFQETLGERSAEPPQTTRLEHQVGSYGL